MSIPRMRYLENKWNWMFWEDHRAGEKEILIYSPNSYASGEDRYYVVVLFKTEPGRDWWICQFHGDDDSELELKRIENYHDKLRDAMTACYALNKLIGAT